MTTTWALLADRSRARIIARKGAGKPLELVEEIDHPEGRLHDRDIDSDAPGRAFDRGGEGRHSMSTEEAPRERLAADFARTLAQKLRDARNAHRFERLVLAAEPRFLGLLRDALDEPTRKLVRAELKKHLLGSDDREIESALADAMR